MPSNRKSKQLHWVVMLQLEEAGEEDLISLLNYAMGLMPSYGTGEDVKEFLEAIDTLEKQGELQTKSYQPSDMMNRAAITDDEKSHRKSNILFDTSDGIWKWKGVRRLMIEVTDG